MTLARARSFLLLLPGTLVAFAVLGCGPQGGGELALIPFERQADTAVAALDEDNKADATSASALVLGEILPNTPVSATVSTSRPIAGWTLRTDGDSGTISATATAASPTGTGTGTAAPVALYRRQLSGAPSCLGEWVRIASGAAAINPKLPGPGDYLLVTGVSARSLPGGSGSSVPVQVEYRVDDNAKIVTPAYVQERPYKIARSWIPTTAQQKLATAGLKRFSEITPNSIKSLSSRTGLSPEVLSELERLKGWLDTPGVTYPAACALKRAGMNNSRDYYRATFAAQQRLKNIIPPGALPWGPDVTATDGASSGLGPCWNLQPPQPSQPARGPYIEWLWWENGVFNPNRIDGRPWWTGHDGQQNDPRWYPAPEKGWEIMAYNLGRPPEPTGNPPPNDWFYPDKNRGATGYILMNNRHLGLMRLFAYVPRSKSFNGMVGTLSLTNPSGRQVATWNFPLEPTPPGRRQASALWQYGKPYDDGGSGNFTPQLTNGTWVRSEIPTLFDPSLYNTGEVWLRVNFHGLDETTLNLDFGRTETRIA